MLRFFTELVVLSALLATVYLTLFMTCASIDRCFV